MTTAIIHRRLFELELVPVIGTRFQPTGFPDIGHAVFDRPVVRNGDVELERRLIVESPQSMANHLEAAAWDAAESRPADAVQGLSYVRVVHENDGSYLTSSRTEAHRLASAFIKDARLDGEDMRTVIKQRLNLRPDRPLVPRDIARQVFALDPFCLIHGVFFAENATVWPGQPRIARALSAVIEAVDVQRADSGGVKRDHVRHHLEADDNKKDVGGTKKGYGTIPYHRAEYTARAITALVSLDLDQLRGYGLGDAATELLETIALWELRTLLEGGLRLRTACDLELLTPDVVDRDGRPLPARAALDDRIRVLVADCAELAAPGGPIEVRWRPPKSTKKTEE